MSNIGNDISKKFNAERKAVRIAKKGAKAFVLFIMFGFVFSWGIVLSFISPLIGIAWTAGILAMYFLRNRIKRSIISAFKKVTIKK